MRLRTHTTLTILQSAVQGTKALPLQSVGRKAIGLPLTDLIAAQHFAPRFIVALMTRQIELAAPLKKVVLASF